MEETMLKSLIATKKRIEEIDEELASEDVTKDINHFKAISKERASIEKTVELYEEYLKCQKLKEDAFLMMNEEDAELSSLAKEEYQSLSEQEEKLVEELKVEMLPKDPNNDKNIIMEIRGAVGGDEANIFAGDLFRMYQRFAESQGWKIQILDQFPSEAGGFSMISCSIKGVDVYSKLKFESGGHRVQRVPVTEASGRIHTSTATVLVMPEAEEIDVTINQSDLHVDTYRSQGAGGQNVNKTESAVRITHVPTGVVVSCQTEKSQIQNREIAMRMLRAKLYAKFEEEQQEKLGKERKLKVGTGERSEKIRTYNYPQNRVTDHRIGFTIQKLDRVMEGDIEDIINALIYFDQQQKFESLHDENK